MKSRNAMMLSLALTLLSLTLLASCSTASPSPVGNQLSCPALQPVDPSLMQPVTPHFQSDWQTWLNSPAPGSSKPTVTP